MAVTLVCLFLGTQKVYYTKNICLSLCLQLSMDQSNAVSPCYKSLLWCPRDTVQTRV